ncbi:hypothetical protein [Sphingomonas sp. ERG5]|uniref:hypothetical protein n=1 Tax=Sphingomonas sp. ERG5 TaxID=1381597 RepID=UPI00054C13E7|nr:hypothetical protein [Sphingomonas sp. ERG5]
MTSNLAGIGAALIAFASLTPPALADSVPAQDCYDAAVHARVVQQIPSEFPDCDDCAIMSWPWFLDLKVKRVLEGQARKGTISVLSVQHTYLISRFRTWWLRRNTAGSFNVLRLTSDQMPKLCPADAAPVAPYIGRGDGKTLDDLRRTSEQHYGRHPD